MSNVRCSNCEKSIMYRTKDGIMVENDNCKTLGITLDDSERYKERKCQEFILRKEYQSKNIFLQFLTYILKHWLISSLIVGLSIAYIVYRFGWNN